MFEDLSPNLAALGLVAGAALGFLARRGRFCTLAAIEDAIYAADLRRLRSWALAAGVAMIGTQLLALVSAFDLSDTIYVGPPLEWGGAILGGLLFGVGMALVETCGFGTLLRLGGGDLKALLTFLVIGITAYMAMRGLTGLIRLPRLRPQIGTPRRTRPTRCSPTSSRRATGWSGSSIRILMPTTSRRRVTSRTRRARRPPSAKRWSRCSGFGRVFTTFPPSRPTARNGTGSSPTASASGSAEWTWRSCRGRRGLIHDTSSCRTEAPRRLPAGGGTARVAPHAPVAQHRAHHGPADDTRLFTGHDYCPGGREPNGKARSLSSASGTSISQRRGRRRNSSRCARGATASCRCPSSSCIPCRSTSAAGPSGEATRAPLDALEGAPWDE